MSPRSRTPLESVRGIVATAYGLDADVRRSRVREKAQADPKVLCRPRLSDGVVVSGRKLGQEIVGKLEDERGSDQLVFGDEDPLVTK